MTGDGADRTVKFMSLASGSNGNCYYVGVGNESLLVDAGIGIRTIKKRLADAGLSFGGLRGVLVTHEHSDHIRGIGSLGKRHALPIYGTGEVLKRLTASYYVSALGTGVCHTVIKEETFEIGSFRVTAFEIPHDSVDNVGYFIECNGVRLMVATDVGDMTEAIGRFLRKASHVVIEANYDAAMLAGGSYPQMLKTRITGRRGHMSNAETGEVLARFYHTDLQEIWLCHLSGENNLPDVARRTVADRLKAAGVEVGKDVRLDVLLRGEVSDIYHLVVT
jgi:phosphoribosyl 1,2-cyclic phosphodiesterase